MGLPAPKTQVTVPIWQELICQAGTVSVLQVFLYHTLIHNLFSQQSDGLLRTAVDAPVAHGTPLILHCLPLFHGNVLHGTQAFAHAAAHTFLRIDLQVL